MSDPPAAAAWRRLVGCFGTWRLARAALTSLALFGIYSLDRVSSLRRSPMGRDALAMLDGVGEADFAALSALAAINQERNEAMWRMAVMFYISVPVTLALATFQIAPGFVRNLPQWLPLPFWAAVTGLLVFMLYSFITLWRARQITAVLALVKLERDHAAAQAGPAVTRSEGPPPRARNRSARPPRPRA